MTPHSANFPALVLTNCLSGNTERVQDFPFQIQEIDTAGQLVLIEFFRTENGTALTKISGNPEAVLLNGTAVSQPLLIEENATYSLQIGARLMFAKITNDTAWPPEFNPAIWQIFNATTGELLGETPPLEIPAFVAGREIDAAQCAICPKGLDTGFYLSNAGVIFSEPDDTAPAQIISDKGKFLCPSCWLRFDAGDALSIAVHESLRNDPVLGANHMLRFNPTRFNDAGQALDPMGLACTEVACPHCHRRLPPAFLELPHKILSLIGAPSAGKSYFLAVLTKRLQDNLYRDFGLIFKDGDPSGNMLLNQMRSKLFSGFTPEECVLGKTAMEGATYERLPRFGKWVSLPRPFVYVLDNANDTANDDAALIFYDNAGEHFEPGHNIDDSPGALHVASSSGILFLFDPTSNPRFRKELVNGTDPQLRQHGRADQQDSILAEMEVRVKKILGLSPAEKIPVPIAVLIGKCDVWQTLFDARKLPGAVANGKIDTGVIDRNSAQLRAFMTGLCPGLVAHAESLSNDVRYFAISSLGHSPVQITGGVNAGLLAPDPQKLNPIGIETPVYWLLSKALPNLVPSN